MGKEDAFNPRANLTNQDCHLDVRRLQGSITITHSKTNQFHQRTHTIPLAGYGGKGCVVTALHKMLRVTTGASREPGKPLFQIKTARGYVPMTRSYFVKAFKQLAKAAGYDPDLFAGHSFRRGSGTRAFKLRCNPDLSKWQGDWISDAWEQYIELDEQQKLIIPSTLAADLAQHESQNAR